MMTLLEDTIVPPLGTIKVSAKSRPTAVAGAIAGVMRENGSVTMQAIGAAAVNQAVKAIAVAKMYLVQDRIEIACSPSFSEVDIDGEARTAILFEIYRHC